MRLLMCGASADATDGDGDSSLMLSTCNNHVKVVKVLLNYGCDVGLTSDYGRTALHMAAWNGHDHLVQLLLDSHCPLNTMDQYGDTAIMLAALNGHCDVIQTLVTAKCDVNSKNYDKDTALHYAAKKGFTTCCQLLINAGVELDSENRWDYTPLILAVTEDRNETVQLLLQSGSCADRPCTLNRGKTALHYAVQRGNKFIVQVLLQYGADVDARDASDNTPLMDAIYHNHVDIVRILLKVNCDVKIIGKGVIRGQWVPCTPLDLAFDRSSFVIAQMLLMVCCDKLCLHPEILQDMPGKVCNEHLLNVFIDRLCSPNSLSEQCRFVIREYLGYFAGETAHQLPLPKSIIAYIRLCDIDDLQD